MFSLCSTLAFAARMEQAAAVCVDLPEAIVRHDDARRVMPERENDHIVATPDEARAGVTGHHVRTVLVAGTLGVAVLFAAVYLYYFV